ncbi:MAG: hypothetical protein IPM32_01265 [Ignavibacteriae bacterium]|nr:hypothetical protein [Ignavibacteriota bacterium]
MKIISSKIVLILAIVFFLFSINACNEENNPLDNENNTTEKETLEKIVESDESLESFDLNYNEEEAMDFVLGKTSATIYPVKVGQRMKLVDKTLDVEFKGELAYGTLTSNYEGVLFIMASEDSSKGGWGNIDLDVYEKPFNTTIKRNLIFTKIANTSNPDSNWRLTSISLPEGGTLTENIEIESIKIYLPNNEEIVIDNPLDYYFNLGISGGNSNIPTLIQFEKVKVEVNIKSKFETNDYVTLTYGAIKNRLTNRAKRKLELINEEFDGSYYHRTYSGEWIVNQFRGRRHAVINAFSHSTLNDSEASVESKSWGIPYRVN